MINNDNVDPISGVKLACNKQYYKLSDIVTCTVTLKRGSDVSYHVDFGDGTSSSYTDPEMLSFMSPWSFSHE